MASILLGYHGHLYIGDDPLNHKQGDPTPPTPLHDFQTVNWSEMAEIGDSQGGGDPESVDTSTRATLRTGFKSEIDIAETGQITWTAQKRLLNEDPLLRQLVLAKYSKVAVSLLDLSEAIDVEGAFGTVGNYTINFTDSKPVKGVQVVEFTAKLLGTGGFSDVVEVDSTPQLIRLV